MMSRNAAELIAADQPFSRLLVLTSPLYQEGDDTAGNINLTLRQDEKLESVYKNFLFWRPSEFVTQSLEGTMFLDNGTKEAVEFQQLSNTVLAINQASISEWVRLGLYPLCSCWKATLGFCNAPSPSHPALGWPSCSRLGAALPCRAELGYMHGSLPCWVWTEKSSVGSKCCGYWKATEQTIDPVVHKIGLYVVPTPGVLFLFGKVRGEVCICLVSLFPKCDASIIGVTK